MQGKDLDNPFKKNRLSFSQTSSLLSYGDDSFSMIKMLKKNSKLSQSYVQPSQKSMEEKVLQKYEKQFYQMDQQGHSLSEQSFDQKILGTVTQTSDFLSQINFPKTTKCSEHFSKGSFMNEMDTASCFTSSTFKNKSNRKDYSDQSISGRRRRICEQAAKLKKVIRSKKVAEENEGKTAQKYSVFNMYKNKHAQEPKTAQFIQIVPESVKQESPRKQHLNFQYPQTIFIRQIQYFRVPFS